MLAKTSPDMLSHERWVASGESVEIDLARGGQANIFRRRAGRGVPVLFIHGFPTSSWDFSKIEPMLEERYQLHYLDLLGFGASDKPRGHRYDLLEQTDIVEKVAVSYGLGRVHVVAHDYGVSIGQELLTRAASGRLPFELASLTLLNGGLYPELHRPLTVQRLLRVPLVGAFVARRFDAARFETTMREISPLHPPSREDLVEQWTAISTKGGAALAHELIHYIDDRRKHGDAWSHALETTAVPLCFLWGMKDPISGAHMIDHVETRLGRPAPISRFFDVGHYPQVEAPGRTAANLMAFLESQEFAHS